MKWMISISVSIILSVFSVSLSFGQDNKTASDTTSTKKEAPSKKKYDREIAITFDNLPGAQMYAPAEIKSINNDIFKALKKYKAPATAFAVGEYIEGEEWEIIVKWLDQGHTIGFHTYSGQGLYDAPLSMFLDDVMKGKRSVEDLVTTYKQTGRYFRFPFLQYATDARMKEMIIDEFIKARIRIAHASVLAEDFVYNMTLEKILPTADSTDINQLRAEYLDHILERLGHAETVAMEVAGRPVRHILNLRVGRINSFFLEDILGELKDKGYQFVSLRHALGDKIYRKEESYFGTQGLSYLERIKLSGEE